MGFLGVAGFAIIALYVYAQGRRSRVKEAAESAADPLTGQTEPSTAARPTGARPTGTGGE